MEEKHTCINCGFEHSSNYCPECGQKREVRPLTWRGLFYEISAHWIGTDNRFMRTFIGLTTRPKALITDYLEGNRVKYIAPLPYLLIVSAIYIFSFGAFDIDIGDFLQESSNMVVQQDPNMSDQQRQFMTDFGNLFSNNMRLFSGALIPFLALSMSIFYRGKSYIVNFLIMAYTSSHLLWLSVISIPIFKYSDVLILPYLSFVSIAYFSWVISGLNPQKSKIWSVIKPIIAWLVGYLFFMIIMMIIIFIYIINMYAQG